MKVSLNAVKQFTSVDVSADELVAKINAQLGTVEEVRNLGPKYAGAIIVRVVSCEDHPNADRLHVCKIDDGGVVDGVERDEAGLVQVVCGAPNVRADMYAVWLPPKATVPASFDEAEPFVLDVRPLRGVASNGMLASPKELALGESHEGILEIDAAERIPGRAEVRPGAAFAEIYGLNDTIIDIENKMFTHRPDLFGQIGVAREIAGIQQHAFRSPDWYMDIPAFDSAKGLNLETFVDSPDNVPRFMAVGVRGVRIAPSPVWLQAAIVRMGGKPINNVVDATNYVMFMTAQPTHAYDYGKIRGHQLGARMAANGEKIELLNGKTYALTADDIVIVDGEGPVGLAGVMGGGMSEVDAETTDIVLEVATFDMYAVRKSSMRHGLFTDALSRFNKGQSPLQTDRVLAYLLQLIQEIAGGEQATAVYDHRVLSEGVFSEQSVHGALSVTTKFINTRLGAQFSTDEIATLLRNVECMVTTDGDNLEVIAPYWRTDIELPEDVVEEVGRLFGYDRLPSELPARTIAPVAQSPENQLTAKVREALVGAGANEVLTYSFVRDDLLLAAGQDPEQAFSLSNALSPDLRYYRLSLSPSLASKLHMNSKAGFDEFALFEQGKGHACAALGDDGLPAEWRNLALIYTANDKLATKKQGAAYYQAQRFLNHMFGRLGMEYSLRPASDPAETQQLAQMLAAFDTARSAEVVVGDTVVGYVGEYHATMRQKLKMPAYSAGFEIGLDLLPTPVAQPSSYVPLSRFPKVEQDVTFKVSDDTLHATVADLFDASIVASAPEDVQITIRPLAVYQPAEESTKNLSFRITAAHYDRTMTDGEVAAYLKQAADALHAKLGAELV